MTLRELVKNNGDRRHNSQRQRLKAGLGVGTPLAIVLGIADKKFGWGLESWEIAGLSGLITTGAICTLEKIERVCIALYSLAVLYLRRRRK